MRNKLKKLILPKGTRETLDKLKSNLEDYLTMKYDHHTLSTPEMRVVYNQGIEDLSFIYSISKNLVRKNIRYVDFNERYNLSKK